MSPEDRRFDDELAEAMLVVLALLGGGALVALALALAGVPFTLGDVLELLLALL